MTKKQKLIYIDVENSHDVVAKFGLYPEYVNPGQIIQGWYMFCACWAYDDSPVIKGVSIHQFKDTFKKDHTNDYHVVKELREAIMKADVIVAHNGDKFDIPKLNARLIYHRLPPLPTKLKTIDTLKLAKKHFRFTANRLDYLGKYLGVGCKVRNPEGLWMDALQGIASALRQMFGYCKGDISLLRNVFKVMQPYISHTQLRPGDVLECTKCDHPLQKRGDYTTATGIKKKRLNCTQCGSWFLAPIKKDGTLGRIGDG